MCYIFWSLPSKKPLLRSHSRPEKHVFVMHIIILFFPIFLTSRSNDEYERQCEFRRQGDNVGPAGMVELEEEGWVTSGVGILKLSVLLYSNTAIFHVQVEVHVEISF